MEDKRDAASADAYPVHRAPQAVLVSLVVAAVLSGSAVAVNATAPGGNGIEQWTVPKFGTANGWRYPFRTAAEQDFELSQATDAAAKLMRIGCSASPSFVAAIQKMVSRGIEPVCLLGGNPNYPWKATPAAFGSDCGRTAAALAGKARFFEALNEPNLHGWSPDTYLPYLKACYEAIKRADSDAIVLHAGLWTSPAWPLIKWVERLYDIGGRPYFDLMNVHLYDDAAEHGSWSIWDMTYGSGGAGFYDTKNVRSIMNARGDATKPIVSTESGGPVPKYSLAKQATIVTNAMKSADGVGRGYRRTLFVLVYNILDDDVAGFGLLDRARARRPAFYAFQTLARAR